MTTSATITRDPKKYPVEGEIFRRFGVTRLVTSRVVNDRGTTTHVIYNEQHSTPIATWRQWANMDCQVINVAPVEMPIESEGGHCD